MPSPADNPARRWIVSPTFDVAIVVIPLVFAVATLIGLRAFDVQQPLWAYLIYYVAFDVAHVWGTIYITYLDKEAFARRRWLYTLSIPACLGLAFAAHLYSPQLFWTAMAYVAIYHFAKQQYGFVAIYKGKAGERGRFDYRLDKLATWAGTIGPVLMWHATPGAKFDWFDSGEAFAFTLPPAVLPALMAIWGAIGAVYVGRQVHAFVRERRFNAGKNLWMVATWVAWFVGIRHTDHLFISAAFLNLLHGLPYLALVWRRCNVRWEGKTSDRSRLVAWVSQRRNWLAFVGILFAIAFLEETLWDGLVWGKYIAAIFDVPAPTLGAIALSFWVALLSMPQLVHYWLDGFLWKMNEHNPDLRDALLK